MPMVVKNNWASDGVGDGGADNNAESLRYYANKAVRDGDNDDNCGDRDKR